MKFAERLKQLMDENQTSNYELGKKTGTHPTTVSNWLAGSEPQARKLQAIAEYYNVSIEYLKGETDIKKDPIPENGNEVSEIDQLVLDLFHNLTPENKQKVLAHLFGLGSE